MRGAWEAYYEYILKLRTERIVGCDVEVHVIVPECCRTLIRQAVRAVCE